MYTYISIFRDLDRITAFYMTCLAAQNFLLSISLAPCSKLSFSPISISRENILIRAKNSFQFYLPRNHFIIIINFVG